MDETEKALRGHPLLGMLRAGDLISGISIKGCPQAISIEIPDKLFPFQPEESELANTGRLLEIVSQHRPKFEKVIKQLKREYRRGQIDQAAMMYFVENFHSLLGPVAPALYDFIEKAENECREHFLINRQALYLLTLLFSMERMNEPLFLR